MDPIHRGPEEFGHDNEGSAEDAVRRRPSRDPLTPDFGQQTPQQARVVTLVAGDLLLTINPVDGSEVEPCPPGGQPADPVRRTPAERADRARAATPPVPPGPPLPELPLLRRDAERERLTRLLARGRSVRLIGPAGSGRTALLDAVAAACADFAPDGVVRLSGHKRTAADLLYGLFDAVHDAPRFRPDRAQVLTALRTTGAVVVLDDLEFGGAALDELLDATPECAYLFAATPDVAAPGPDAHLEEVPLAGLDRAASVELLERVVERPLTEEEANWAGDLWFESEGLPLRFVQAGALLRQRDALRVDPTAYDEYGYLATRPAPAPDPEDATGTEDTTSAEDTASTGAIEDTEAADVPLPGLGEAAAPAALLASRLGEAARETLRFAVALGGEVPHQAHLPALIGDTHADAALGELAGCGLLSPAGSRYRLAAGVTAQLVAAGYDEGAAVRARTAAQHYTWWTGHPSVTPARACAEADAIVAAMNQLVPGEGAGRTSAAVLLARSAAPVFAAGLHWGAWERALRIGQEAGRLAGEVAEEAYFHHELGVLALCTGHPDRARTELETAIGMRGALADRRGAVAGRRALALVADRSGGPGAGLVPGGQGAAGAFEASPPLGVPALAPVPARRPLDDTAVVPRQPAPGPAGSGKGSGRRVGAPAYIGGARRNLVAAGAGVLLAGVLGTVVTLGLTSSSDPQGGAGTSTEQEVPQDDSIYDAEVTTGEPADGKPTTVSSPGSPSGSASTAVTPGATGSATASPGGESPSTTPSAPDTSTSSSTAPKPSETVSSGKPITPSPGKSGTKPSGSTPPDPDPGTGSPEPTQTPTEDPGAGEDAVESASGGPGPDPALAQNSRSLSSSMPLSAS
ncbi:ATP-binding protein [Streptomyces sp. NBC_00525]|uniref:ATP-binding protein n=1 Tax=Streptomyces sp. NBC_00525 TaxID=2903660 RepID=UPI002E80B2FB|nr:ATP-binding protein [Streptomyces sp. NBC_00525]WUC96022.1 ATP-binding protein [Streptomyces sp. NBC_00525]